jgi:hypothetical protein
MSNLDTIIVENNSVDSDYTVKSTQYETRKALRTLPMNRVMTKGNIETFIGESTKYTQPMPVKKRKKKSSQMVQKASIADAIPTPSTINVADTFQTEDTMPEDNIPIIQPVSVVNNKINTNLCLKLYTFFIIFGILCLIGFFVYKLVQKRKNNENKPAQNETNPVTIEGGKNNNKTIRKRDARGRFIKSK